MGEKVIKINMEINCQLFGDEKQEDRKEIGGKLLTSVYLYGLLKWRNPNFITSFF